MHRLLCHQDTTTTLSTIQRVPLAPTVILSVPTPRHQYPLILTSGTFKSCPRQLFILLSEPLKVPVSIHTHNLLSKALDWVHTLQQAPCWQPPSSERSQYLPWHSPRVMLTKTTVMLRPPPQMPQNNSGKSSLNSRLSRQRAVPPIHPQCPWPRWRVLTLSTQMG